MVLAPANATCSELVRKRVVFGLFVLPFNGLDPAEEKKVGSARSIRMKEVMAPLDILFSILGFGFGVVTRTFVYERCSTDFVLREKGAKRATLGGDAELNRLRDEQRKLRAELEGATAERDRLIKEREQGPARSEAPAAVKTAATPL